MDFVIYKIKNDQKYYLGHDMDTGAVTYVAANDDDAPLWSIPTLVPSDLGRDLAGSIVAFHDTFGGPAYKNPFLSVKPGLVSKTPTQWSQGSMMTAMNTLIYLNFNKKLPNHVYVYTLSTKLNLDYYYGKELTAPDFSWVRNLDGAIPDDVEHYIVSRDVVG